MLSASLKRQALIYMQMPKHKTKKAVTNERETQITDSPVKLSAKGTGLLINILAKPGAKQNAVTDIAAEGVSVQLAAPPVEGQANTELVSFLAQVFKVRKSDVSLERGSKSRVKTVSVQSLTVEEAMYRLRQEMEHD